MDGRYHGKIPKKLRELFSEYGLIYYRLETEIEWIVFRNPELSSATIKILKDILDNFTVEQAEIVKDIEKTTNHDVKAAEYYLRDKFKSHKETAPLIPHIHFALTSEDVNNISYAKILSKARVELNSIFNTIGSELKESSAQYSDAPLMSRTHGQAATPTTFGKEMANFYARLHRAQNTFNQVGILAKINGAVGNHTALSLVEKNHQKIIANAEAFISFINSGNFAKKTAVESGVDSNMKLGGKIKLNHYTTQIEPGDWVAEYLHALSRISSIFLDLSKDMWLYISYDYIMLKSIQSEIGSSTMPHKVNPIHFENAEGNLNIAVSLFHQLAQTIPNSRLQRDLSGSTTMRNLGSAICYLIIASNNLEKGLGRIELNSAKIEMELESHWELLTEAIQTHLRVLGRNDAYEIIKEISRGKTFDQNKYNQVVAKYNLQSLIGDLTPEKYTGLAQYLATNLEAFLAEEKK